jgi:outer membrane translocation and assembly module TamA
MDAGSVWNNGGARSKYYRSAGVELLSEIKALYQFPIPLRLGIARGFDEPGGTRVYLHLGQAF